jgi:hypothetical protein
MILQDFPVSPQIPLTCSRSTSISHPSLCTFLDLRIYFRNLSVPPPDLFAFSIDLLSRMSLYLSCISHIFLCISQKIPYITPNLPVSPTDLSVSFSDLIFIRQILPLDQLLYFILYYPLKNIYTGVPE